MSTSPRPTASTMASVVGVGRAVVGLHAVQPRLRRVVALLARAARSRSPGRSRWWAPRRPGPRTRGRSGRAPSRAVVRRRPRRCCRRACAPGPRARPSARRRPGHRPRTSSSDLVRQLGQAVVGVEEADRAGALRQEDVGGALVALLVDEQRQLGRVAVADVDVDAGLLGELLEQRADQLLRAAAVDRPAGRRPMQQAGTRPATSTASGQPPVIGPASSAG